MTIAPGTAFFNTDEAMVEFISRCRGAKTLEDKNILEMHMKNSMGEIALDLSFCSVQATFGIVQ
jgi:hypothetical protein